MASAVPAVGHGPADTSERTLNGALQVIRLGPALILVLLVAIMTLASPFFMTGDNLSNIAVQVAPLACLAIGQLFVILVGGIDLSVGKPARAVHGHGRAGLRLGRFGGLLVIPVMLLTGWRSACSTA